MDEQNPDKQEDSGKQGGAGSALSSGAGAALSKATGTSGAKGLASRKSTSDGSLAGDTKELVDNTKAGAELGGKVGGGYGAAIGGAVGAGASVVKNKRTRKRILLMLIVPNLIVALIIATIIQATVSSFTRNAELRQRQAHEAATAEGLKDEDVAAYVDAADSSGVHWALLAAVDWSAGNWSSPGDPPYGITDLKAFNAELVEYGADPLSAEEAKDRVAVGYAYGRLFALKLAEAEPDVDPYTVDAGASLMIDPEDPERYIRGIDPDDTDGVAAHEATRKAFEANLAGMPASTSKDEEKIFAAAFRWAVGQPQQGEAADACVPGNAVSISTGELPTIGGFNDVQIENAATVIGVGQELKLPVSAWQIALMTSLVESQLLNLGFGHLDSVGLFQQRPSAGWGTEQEIRNPVLATTAFFGMAEHTKNPGLTDIKGWEDLPLGDAAQKVQVSEFPDEYAKREAEAALLIKHLEGITVEATSTDGCADEALGEFANCPKTPWPDLETPPELGKLIPPDALRTLRCGHQEFPEFTTAYTYGKRAVAADEHGTGRAVDWMVPGGWQNAKGKEVTNRLADWLVRNWKPLGVQYVIWDNKIWNIERDSKNAEFPAGWRPYSTCNPPNGTAESCGPTGAHQDHVHVTLFGDRGVVDSGTTLSDGTWGLPTKDNYSLGPGICTDGTVCWGYGGHTGQDFSIFENADILAISGGKVTTAKVICPELTNAQRAGNYGCSYGRFVVIDHGGGMTSTYAHLNDFGPGITVGATVKGGQVIGKEGSQGKSTGPHLHFEIRKDGAAINPVPYLEQQGVPIRCDPKMTANWGGVPEGSCDK